MNPWVRDGLELLMLVALGGAIASAWRRWRAGELQPYRCVACDRPTSRAYARCRHCGAPQP